MGKNAIVATPHLLLEETSVNSFKYALSIAGAVAILSGCATSSKIESISIPGGAQLKKMTIAKVTPSSTKVGRDQIVTAVIASLRAQLGDSPTFRYERAEDKIEVSYRMVMGLNHKNLVANYTLAIDEHGSDYAVTLRCPEVIQSDTLDISLTGFGSWNKDQIAQKISSSCARTSVSIPFYEEIAAEVNVPFNDVSTFSNFRRRLSSGKEGWYAYSKERTATTLSIEKSEKFYAPEPYGTTLVSVAVYPYRNGSKVLYAFVYKYTMTDGGTTYSANTIKDIKKSIVSIAND
jgi:hypothetical protein